MARSKRRTALILYCLLLVLPTVVLASLHWYQLRLEARESLEALPAETRQAAARLGEALRARVATLLDAEDRRPYYHYRSSYAPPGSVGAELPLLPSPLMVEEPVEGVLCRFAYDFDEGTEAPLTFLDAPQTPDPDHARMHQVARELVERKWRDSYLRGTSPRTDSRREELPLELAVANRIPSLDDCAPEALSTLAELHGRNIVVRTFGFHLQLLRETDGTPYLFATRQVWLEPHPELAELPDCLTGLKAGATLVNGFFIDPQWLFEALPVQLAEQVLGGSQVLLTPDSPSVAAGGDLEVVRFLPVEELQIETFEPADRHYASLQVVISTARQRDHYRGQMQRFFGVAAMLFCSLATGIWLLLASVRRDLEHARRTENFVSAVTHELRTPVAAIRLYAEMLRDGWVHDAGKQREYHERIVSETQRLETMVERVLEKGRLIPGREHTHSGDLSEEVAALCAEQDAAGARDLHLELEAELPPVDLDDEALHSILTNLVENARKYAPVPLGSPEAEKIQIRTTLEAGRPVLEVADRGPGIPDEEKAHVLQAFYRMGNEATRSTRGTGLGLHLVDLQARALGGGVTILDRPGGGTVFRVHFKQSSD